MIALLCARVWQRRWLAKIHIFGQTPSLYAERKRMPLGFLTPQQHVAAIVQSGGKEVEVASLGQL